MKLIAALAATLLASQAQAGTSPAIVSYWGADPAAYDVIPGGALALVNPDSGIFVGRGQTMRPVPTLKAYRAVVTRMARRGVAAQGYVPTGYFRHDCNAEGKCQKWDRIEAQVRTYFKEMPGLAGIFFDEAAADQSCDVYDAEYARLRAIVRRYKPNGSITFNPGTPTPCAISAAAPGETIVVFEHDSKAFAEQRASIENTVATARARGVKSWVLLHTVDDENEMLTIVRWAKAKAVDHVYVTSISGDWQSGAPTWNVQPDYLATEIAEMSRP